MALLLRSRCERYTNELVFVIPLCFSSSGWIVDRKQRHMYTAAEKHLIYKRQISYIQSTYIMRLFFSTTTPTLDWRQILHALNKGYRAPLSRRQGARIHHIACFFLYLLRSAIQRRPRQSHQTRPRRLQDAKGRDELHEGLDSRRFRGAGSRD